MESPGQWPVSKIEIHKLVPGSILSEKMVLDFVMGEKWTKMRNWWIFGSSTKLTGFYPVCTGFFRYGIHSTYHNWKVSVNKINFERGFFHFFFNSMFITKVMESPGQWPVSKIEIHKLVPGTILYRSENDRFWKLKYINFLCLNIECNWWKIDLN